MIESPFLEIINYRGKQIMFWNFPKGVTQEELFATMKLYIDFMRENKEFKYILSDYSNIHIGNEVMQLVKSNSTVLRHTKVAFLGITGLKKIILWGYSNITKRQMAAFDTKEEALEYLVKD
jgi:hypothetical protein